MRRLRPIILLLASACALTASMGSCSCSPGKSTGSPVTVEVKEGWRQLGIGQADLERAADEARNAGSGDVADTLVFNADAAKLGDVRLVVLSRGSAAVLTVRTHDARVEPLDVAVARMQNEIEEQEVAVSVTQVTFHGAAAWQFRFTGAPEGLRNDVYWFEAKAQRFSVDVLGGAGDVSALADAVRIER